MEEPHRFLYPVQWCFRACFVIMLFVLIVFYRTVYRMRGVRAFRLLFRKLIFLGIHFSTFTAICCCLCGAQRYMACGRAAGRLSTYTCPGRTRSSDPSGTVVRWGSWHWIGFNLVAGTFANFFMNMVFVSERIVAMYKRVSWSSIQYIHR